MPLEILTHLRPISKPLSRDCLGNGQANSRCPTGGDLRWLVRRRCRRGPTAPPRVRLTSGPRCCGAGCCAVRSGGGCGLSLHCRLAARRVSCRAMPDHLEYPKSGDWTPLEGSVALNDVELRRHESSATPPTRTVRCFLRLSLPGCVCGPRAAAATVAHRSRQSARC